MPSIEPNPEQIQAFLAADISGPIHMLNLLKFKADGGREAYGKYSEKTMPLLQERGGKIAYHAEGKAAVIGNEQWDTIIIVEYPNREAFFDMIQSEQYEAGQHLRTEALEDSRLVCMQTG